MVGWYHRLPMDVSLNQTLEDSGTVDPGLLQSIQPQQRDGLATEQQHPPQVKEARKGGL